MYESIKSLESESGGWKEESIWPGGSVLVSSTLTYNSCNQDHIRYLLAVSLQLESNT